MSKCQNETCLVLVSFPQRLWGRLSVWLDGWSREHPVHTMTPQSLWQRHGHEVTRPLIWRTGDTASAWWCIQTETAIPSFAPPPRVAPLIGAVKLEFKGLKKKKKKRVKWLHSASIPFLCLFYMLNDYCIELSWPDAPYLFLTTFLKNNFRISATVYMASVKRVAADLWPACTTFCTQVCLIKYNRLSQHQPPVLLFEQPAATTQPLNLMS